MPAELAGLPPEHVSHSSQHYGLAQFAGRAVTVLGAGASALDLAAGLRKAGASVTVVARRRAIRFFPPKGGRTWLDAIRAPMTPLGPGWKKLLCVKAPLLFSLLPEATRIGIVHRYLGPAPTWHVRDLVVGHVDMQLGASVEAARMQAGRVALDVRQADGTSRTVLADHVIAATGYRMDVARLAFLDAAIVRALDCVNAIPRLTRDFESSIPGLHFAGTISSYRFGPMLRFVCGAGYAARRLTRHLLARENPSWLAGRLWPRRLAAPAAAR